MEKKFYMGQPLIVKETGEKVTFVYDNGDGEKPCNALKHGGDSSINGYGYDQVEPSTELKFADIIAGLEHGYFEVGTEFERSYETFVVCETPVGLSLRDKALNPINTDVKINGGAINKIWTRVVPPIEMTLDEIEAKLGHKVKLKAEKINQAIQEASAPEFDFDDFGKGLDDLDTNEPTQNQ